MNRSIWALLKRVRSADDPSSDEMVLQRFVTQRDETAFELLVWRHGGFVLNLCRRMLRDDHAAEDAFQATFLILARKASSVRGSLAAWLYQVSRRVCLRAKQKTPALVLMDRERTAPESPDPVLSAELSNILDEEIAKLPEKLKRVVIHCYLQNRTTDDAATTLGILRGTVLSRLSHARQQLSAWLTRRGITAPAALLTVSVTIPSLSADVCRHVTMKAMEFSRTLSITSISSQLAMEIIRMSARKNALSMASILILTASAGLGVSIVMAQSGGGKPAATTAKAPDTKVREEQRDDAAKLAEEIQKEKQHVRLSQLSQSYHDLSVSIQMLEKKNFDMVRETATEVAPKILQLKLDEIDTQILKNEEIEKSIPDSIKNFEHTIAELKAGRMLKNQQMVDALNLRVSQNLDVKDAVMAIINRSNDVRQIKQQDDQDSTRLQNFEKKLKLSQDKLETIRNQIQPQEEKKMREEYLLDFEMRLKNEVDRIGLVRKHTLSLWEDRASLVMRIHKAKATLQSQLIDDEIQVMREVRKQVLKERLMLEMGLNERAK